MRASLRACLGVREGQRCSEVRRNEEAAPTSLLFLSASGQSSLGSCGDYEMMWDALRGWGNPSVGGWCSRLVFTVLTYSIPLLLLVGGEVPWARPG